MRWRTRFPKSDVIPLASVRHQGLPKLWQKILDVCFLVPSVLSSPAWAQSNFEYNKQAEFDAQGNIYVSSNEGKLIKMATQGHCSWAQVAMDKQTVGCLVARVLDSGMLTQSLELDIYLKGGKKRTIEPGASIRDWHFLKDGQQVSVYFGPPDANEPGFFALYESVSGRLIDKLAESPDEGSLPQWAKTRAQLQDESVPMSPTLMQERIMWISKVLRQIDKIKPGMRRQDLLKVFTTEGGLSNRFQRTYVHKECPYIKVDVRFKAANNEHEALKEEPEDIIEIISRPYLAWGVAD